jgi:hypothetical protein
MKILDSALLIDLIKGKEEAIKLLNTVKYLLTVQISMFEVIKVYF